MSQAYFDAISLIERLHRQFLEIVKFELDSMNVHDINNVQALILFNIGDNAMTVGDLTLRGCYLGSNVSYNVKKMVETGYIVQERCSHDRRSIYVKLTDKGRELRAKLQEMYDRHIAWLAESSLSQPELEQACQALRRLERFWMRASNLVQRPQLLSA